MKSTPPAKHGRRACLRRQSQARPEAQKSPPAILNFAKFKKKATFSLLKAIDHGQWRTRRKREKWFSSLCDFAFQKSSRILRAHRHKKSSRQSHTGTFGTNRNLKSRFRDFIKRFVCSNRGITRAPGGRHRKKFHQSHTGEKWISFLSKIDEKNSTNSNGHARTFATNRTHGRAVGTYSKEN